jgi:hypothetical protein
MSIPRDFIAKLTVGQFCVLQNLSVDDLVVLTSSNGGTGGKFPQYTEEDGQMVIGEKPAEDPGNTVNIRTEQGRAEYDDKIRHALLGVEGGWIKGAALRLITGGASGQLRGRLNALLELEEIEYKGKAAGMEYRLTRKGKTRAQKEEPEVPKA